MEANGLPAEVPRQQAPIPMNRARARVEPADCRRGPQRTGRPLLGSMVPKRGRPIGSLSKVKGGINAKKGAESGKKRKMKATKAVMPNAQLAVEANAAAEEPPLPVEDPHPAIEEQAEGPPIPAEPPAMEPHPALVGQAERPPPPEERLAMEPHPEEPEIIQEEYRPEIQAQPFAPLVQGHPIGQIRGGQYGNYLPPPQMVQRMELFLPMQPHQRELMPTQFFQQAGIGMRMIRPPVPGFLGHPQMHLQQMGHNGQALPAIPNAWSILGFPAIIGQQQINLQQMGYHGQAPPAVPNAWPMWPYGFHPPAHHP